MVAPNLIKYEQLSADITTNKMSDAFPLRSEAKGVCLQTPVILDNETTAGINLRPHTQILKKYGFSFLFLILKNSTEF